MDHVNIITGASIALNLIDPLIDADTQVLAKRLTALLADISQGQQILSMSFGLMLPILSSPLLYSDQCRQCPHQYLLPEGIHQ